MKISFLGGEMIPALQWISDHWISVGSQYKNTSLVCPAGLRLNELINGLVFSAGAEYITVSVPFGPAASSNVTGVIPARTRCS